MTSRLAPARKVFRNIRNTSNTNRSRKITVSVPLIYESSPESGSLHVSFEREKDSLIVFNTELNYHEQVNSAKVVKE